MVNPKLNPDDLAEVVEIVSLNLQKRWEDKENLKKAIIEDLHESRSQKFYKWLKHPLIITIVGILATAGLGRLITGRIESSIAKQNRNELLDEKLLLSRMELSEEIIESLNDLYYSINKVLLCHSGAGQEDSLKRKSIVSFQNSNAAWLKKRDSFRMKATLNYENHLETISAIEAIDSVLYEKNEGYFKLELYVRALAKEPHNKIAIESLNDRFKEFKECKKRLIEKISLKINSLPERE